MNRVNISNSKIQKNNLNNTNKTIDMNDPNKLSDLFKEIQDIRYGRAKPEELEEEKKEKVSNRKKMSSRSFNAIGVIIGVFFLIAFYTSIHSTYIFATATEEKKAIRQYEVNDDPIDVMGIISTNNSESTSKEIVTKDVEIPYETKTVENDLLPKDDKNIIQSGEIREYRKNCNFNI